MLQRLEARGSAQLPVDRSQKEWIVEMQHHLVDVVASRSKLTAQCSCGWLAVPASSEEHARKRWAIHATQQRAAILCSKAAALGMSAQARGAELAMLTTQVRQRRAILSAHRERMHRALWEADQRALELRPPLNSTLECARQLAGLSEVELWLRYVTMGGSLGQEQFKRALNGLDELNDRDYDVVSAVLNEEFRDAGLGDPLPTPRRRRSAVGGAAG
jgi:hypothetical protein